MTGTGLLPSAESNFTEQEPVLVNLHDLENALENVTAALFWSAAHIRKSGFEKPPSHTGIANINKLVLTSHLKLNVVPVIIGLCTSISLLFLAMCMVGIKDSIKPPVERVGILHMFWLSGIGSMAQEQIALVEKPTTQNLREAGMFEIRIADGSAYIGEDAGGLTSRKRWNR
ncbi:hypothetical protein BDZ94DRAFT_1233283 [Collybia nuda]|uniref:Uncharacterized protein n=1 Tax=Collybia nuda TaxID=64659 RepID=A0A9P5YEC4_9AGAR|nr:hypothetical protein BDZ94DRAFT_1233283 [Collybia nuda]